MFCNPIKIDELTMTNNINIAFSFDVVEQIKTIESEN